MPTLSESPADIRASVIEHAPQSLARTLEQIATGTAPAAPVDLDAYGADYLARVRRARREDTVRDFFGPVLLATDWDHPALMPNRAAIDRVRAWAFGPVGLLICGREPGTGKTRALAALCWRLYVDEARECVFWRSQELFAHIGRFEEFGKDYAAEFVEALAQRAILVIEDLGQEATSRNQEARIQQWFFALLDRRYALGRPCLITTNHTAETLASRPRNELSSDPLIRRLLAVAAPVRFSAKSPVEKP